MNKAFLSAMVASCLLLAQGAHAVTNLGTFSGSAVKTLGGDLDTSPYPDITRRMAQNDAFSVITFTLAAPTSLRLDLAWKDVSGMTFNAVGVAATETDIIIDFSLRSSAGILAPTAAQTYYNDVTLVPSRYGTIPIASTPDPDGLGTLTTASRRAQMSKANIYTDLAAGSYTLTVFAERFLGANGQKPPTLEIGLFTGPDAGFAAYQSALVAPLNLGTATIPNTPGAAWQAAAVPEPGTLMTFGLGLVGLGLVRHRARGGSLKTGRRLPA